VTASLDRKDRKAYRDHKVLKVYEAKTGLMALTVRTV
jgi:hypothetical protein